MKHQYSSFTLSLVIVGLALSSYLGGCKEEPKTPPVNPNPTPQATATPTPQETATPDGTATPTPTPIKGEELQYFEENWQVLEVNTYLNDVDLNKPSVLAYLTKKEVLEGRYDILIPIRMLLESQGKIVWWDPTFKNIYANKKKLKPPFLIHKGRAHYDAENAEIELDIRVKPHVFDETLGSVYITKNP